MASNIVRNNSVEVQTCYGSNNYPAYVVIKYLSVVVLPVFKYLNLHVSKSIMGEVDHFKGPTTALMKCFILKRLNTNTVNICLTNITFYLPLVDTPPGGLYLCASSRYTMYLSLKSFPSNCAHFSYVFYSRFLF